MTECNHENTEQKRGKINCLYVCLSTYELQRKDKTYKQTIKTKQTKKDQTKQNNNNKKTILKFPVDSL